MSAELAEYSGEPGSNQLAVQGHRLLQNPNVWQWMLVECEKFGVFAAAAQGITGALHATELQEVLNEKRELVIASVPNHKIRLKAVEVLIRLLHACVGVSADGLRRPESAAITHNLPLTVPGGGSNSPAADPRNDEFSAMTSQERMLTREAIDAAEAWTEIEKKTRAEKRGSATDDALDAPGKEKE